MIIQSHNIDIFSINEVTTLFMHISEYDSNDSWSNFVLFSLSYKTKFNHFIDVNL